MANTLMVLRPTPDQQKHSAIRMCLYLTQWRENSSALVQHKLLAQRSKTETGDISKS